MPFRVCAFYTKVGYLLLKRCGRFAAVTPPVRKRLMPRQSDMGTRTTATLWGRLEPLQQLLAILQQLAQPSSLSNGFGGVSAMT
jgi:hypothetical protein